MLLTRTVSLTFAAACLSAIVTMPIHAQTAGTYGAAPGYRGAPATYSSKPGYDRPRSDASQASQGDAAQSASARRNVAESHQYDRALQTDFRVSPGAYAQGMRSDFRYRTPSKLPGELPPRRAFQELIKLEPGSAQRLRPIDCSKSRNRVGAPRRAQFLRSVGPSKVLNPVGMRSRRDADRAWQRLRLRPPLWILLAGVIAIGIVIGLSAASFSFILLSSFRKHTPNPAAVSALPHWPTLSANIA